MTGGQSGIKLIDVIDSGGSEKCLSCGHASQREGAGVEVNLVEKDGVAVMSFSDGGRVLFSAEISSQILIELRNRASQVLRELHEPFELMVVN